MDTVEWRDAIRLTISTMPLTQTEAGMLLDRIAALEAVLRRLVEDKGPCRTEMAYDGQVWDEWCQSHRHALPCPVAEGRRLLGEGEAG
jgi:hypothetical protein